MFIEYFLSGGTCICRWQRLSGNPPVVDHTRLSVREFALSPVAQKVSFSLLLLQRDENITAQTLTVSL